MRTLVTWSFVAGAVLPVNGRQGGETHPTVARSTGREALPRKKTGALPRIRGGATRETGDTARKPGTLPQKQSRNPRHATTQERILEPLRSEPAISRSRDCRTDRHHAGGRQYHLMAPDSW